MITRLSARLPSCAASRISRLADSSPPVVDVALPLAVLATKLTAPIHSRALIKNNCILSHCFTFFDSALG